MKPSVKIGLGIFVSLFTIGFIFLYDFYIKDRIDSEEVVVVKAGAQILKSEPITKDKLIIERREKSSLVEDVVYAADIDKIIGQDSKQTIVGNSMISTKMIDYEKLIPNADEGEAIRPITQKMIYAQPGSLRRKDVIDLYLVYGDGTTNLMENGPSKVTSEVTAKETDKETTVTSTTSLSAEEIKLNTKPFLKGVKVVYVKDSGNKEVISAGEGNQDKRLNATSTISDLEVILNEEDFTNLMTEILSKGARLYITYQ
ncbi:hypothetical protein AWM68_17875 [Fictibacillus phosphorivorans]|uniref:SAF domain-containing protein n=1 Tax=Fictibacillus phosphorivorans TaxID=1221500 RepID=A0A163S368_9BACL|nr:hypothetical protein [Fictibacillus phosphorivorans]KZE68039.1 hypothetical protein AWM68_17875 [Fictibacillus phosphorivorans]